jgi:hypothetical protein
MSSPWSTGLRSEALDALPEIVKLARDTLTPEKLQEAESVAHDLLIGKRTKSIALAKLKLEIGMRPTRPLFYLCGTEFDGLPRNTRNCIRYLGDYLDLLTKEMAHEFLGGKSRQTSLGVNARKLAKLPEFSQLATKLIDYNHFLYQPGKHDFSLPPGRAHRFTSREVVLTTYISKVLGDKIKSHSKQARIAVEQDNLYLVGGHWKPGVKYVGESR